jgi:hypothetical protein
LPIICILTFILKKDEFREFKSRNHAPLLTYEQLLKRCFQDLKENRLFHKNLANWLTINFLFFRENYLFLKVKRITPVYQLKAKFIYFFHTIKDKFIDTLNNSDFFVKRGSTEIYRRKRNKHDINK